MRYWVLGLLLVLLPSLTMADELNLSQGQFPDCSGTYTQEGNTLTCGGSIEIDGVTLTSDEPFNLVATGDISVEDSTVGQQGVPINLVSTGGDLEISDSVIFGNLLAEDGDIEIEDSIVENNVEASGDVELDNSSVEGHIKAGEDVELENSSVGGSIEAGEDVALENSSVGGSIEAGEDVELDGSSVGGDIEAGEDVELENSNAGGSIEAGEDIDLENSTVGGSVTAGEDIDLDNSQVGGNATAGGDIDLNNNSNVSGACNKDPDGGECGGNAPQASPFCSATFSADNGRNPDSPLNLSGVKFTPAEAWPASPVNLPGGTYRYEGNVDLDEYRLSVADDEQVIIFVNGSLEFANNTRLNEGGNPENLLIVVNGDLEVGNNLRLSGVVYASGDIDIGNNSQIVGILAAGGIIDTGGGNPTFSPRPDLAADLAIEGACRAEVEEGELADFLIQALGQPNVCEPARIEIQAIDEDNNTLPDYLGTVVLTTSAGRGNWSLIEADGTLNPNPHDTNNGAANYSFVEQDAGRVVLGLANTSADRLRISGIDNDNGVSGISEVIEFLENAFVVDLTDSLAEDIVAGRPHALTVRAIGRDAQSQECLPIAAYEGTVAVKAWVDRAVPEGEAPQVNGTTLGNDEPATAQLELDFAQGTASAPATLETTDIGRYSLQLRDDESGNVVDENGEPIAVTGASENLTVRPFAFDLAVAGNEGAEGPDGPAFVASGQPFPVALRAVLWNSAADSDDDGQPDGHDGESPGTRVDLSANATVPSFALAEDSLDLTARLAAGPSDPADPALRLPEPVSAFAAGEASAEAAYDEVGSIGLVARFNGSYLGKTVALRGDSGFVGRFHPEQFQVTTTPGSFAPVCGDFVYSGQAHGYDLAPELVISPVGFGAAGLLSNYREDWQRLDREDISRAFPTEDNDNGLAVTVDTEAAQLMPQGNGRMDYLFGDDRYTFTKNEAARRDPFTSALTLTVDSIADGDAALDPDQAPLELTPEGVDIRYGRIRLENVFGPEAQVLEMPVQAEFLQGDRFIVNTQDSAASAGVGEECFTYRPAAADEVLLEPEDVALNVSPDEERSLFMGESESGEGILLESANNPAEAGNNRARVTLVVPPWLQDLDEDNELVDPSAIATFGVYRGNDRIIYWRELSN